MALFGFEVQTWKEGLLLSHVVAGLAAAYCYYFVTKLSLGLSRFISCTPVFALYACLPFIFNRSTHLLGLVSLYCIFTWIASFKLLLLCWGHGPGSDESSSFPRFAIVMIYPTHVKRTGKVVKRVEYDPFSSWWEYVSKSEVWYVLVFRSLVKLVVMALVLHLLSFRDALPGMILHLLLSLQVYLFGTIVLELLAAVANALFGVTLEPHFDNPLAADSLEEFWGRRWNLFVSNTLRETVYNPVLSLLGSSSQEIRGSENVELAQQSRRASSSSLESVSVAQEKDKRLGRASPEAELVAKQKGGRRRFDLPKLVAMLAAFLVSGLCHELLVYYSTLEVTWEMTSFFLVQGVAVAVEVAWKLSYPATRPPRGMATLGTLGFVFLSAHWLFWPPLDGISEQIDAELRKILHT